MGRADPCWVIVVGQTATSFRARRRDDLIPTLRQLQRTQPDVDLRWFDRGQLWNSPEQARDALRAQRQAPRDRGPDWRPGGSHKDPRAQFALTRDQKRARFKNRQFRKPKRDDRPMGSDSAGPGAGDGPRSRKPPRKDGRPDRRPFHNKPGSGPRSGPRSGSWSGTRSGSGSGSQAGRRPGSRPGRPPGSHSGPPRSGPQSGSRSGPRSAPRSGPRSGSGQGSGSKPRRPWGPKAGRPGGSRFPKGPGNRKKKP